MSVKSTLSSIGTSALGIVILLALLGFVAIFLVGAEWVGAKILPWLVLLCILAIAFNIVILGPLALIPPTRPWAGIGFFVSSYIFGLTGWFMGFLLTLELWGVFAVVIGLFFLGIGVVPIAMLATLINGMWTELGLLVLAVVLTFGLRILGGFLADSDRSDSEAVTYLQDRNQEDENIEDGGDVTPSQVKRSVTLTRLDENGQPVSYTDIMAPRPSITKMLTPTTPGDELEEDEDWTDEEDEEADWEDEEGEENEEDEEGDWKDEELENE